MRPVFCGNFEYDTRHSDLDRLFSRYGRVDRIDMKSGSSKGTRALNRAPHSSMQNLPCQKETFLRASGFAFVYFEDERDAEDAIRGLDNVPFGYSRRRLSVEWSRGDRGRYRDGSRGMLNMRPTKTLFVINFDPIRTRTRDIERHFEPYGTVVNVRIRRNFAFVQFDSQEEATKALEYTNMSKLLDRVVSVEYAHRDDGEPGDSYDSPRRGYGRRDASPYGRSISPVRRSRPSPVYGRLHSPVYDRYNEPSYNRSRSPVYGHYRSRSPVRRSRT